MHHPSQKPRSLQQRLLRWSWLGCLALLAGCAGEEQPTLDSYLDELEFQSSIDSTREIELGNYGIASALQIGDQDQKNPQTEWVHVRFRLVAIVSPQDERAIEKTLARHRGLLDDTVISVCRKITKGELADSRWGTFKSRLIDALRPILGEQRLRQISFVDFSWETI